MSDKPKKKRFEVEDNESISDCLDRMDKEGYSPFGEWKSLCLLKTKKIIKSFKESLSKK